MAAFFLADFSVGFFLAALFEARLDEVLAPPLVRAVTFFLAGALRAACFLPRDFVVLPVAGLRLAFFLAVALVERLAAFFLADVLVADRFAAFCLADVALVERFTASFAACLRPRAAFFAMVPSFSDS